MARFKKYKKRKFTKKLSPATARAVKHIVTKEIAKSSEMKQYTASVTPVSIYGASAGGTMSHLSDMKQGVLDSERTGDEVNIKGLDLNVLCYMNIGNEYNDIRILVFQYTSTDFSPSFSELFIASNIVGAGAQVNAFSHFNIDYKDVYNILYDKTVHLERGIVNAANYAENGKYWRTVRIKVPLKYAKKIIQYSAASTDALNGIWFAAIGSSAQIAGQDPKVSINYALRFTDS